MDVTEGFANLNNCRFYYRLGGPVDAPVLIFNHSLFRTSHGTY